MVTRRAYVPDRGDVIWLNFDPARGHEQKGRRPAVVVSPRAYNAKSGLMLVCPVTSQAKGYPFEISFQTPDIEGVILADQIRSVDWKERGTERAGSVSDAILADIQGLSQRLIVG